MVDMEQLKLKIYEIIKNQLMTQSSTLKFNSIIFQILFSLEFHFNRIFTIYSILSKLIQFNLYYNLKDNERRIKIYF